jgi:hypothetical protein
MKESVRTGRHGALLDDLGRDVRYAFRLFARQRTFAAVIVGTLALGLGRHGDLLDHRRPLPSDVADRRSRAAGAARERAAFGAAVVDLPDLAGNPAT